MPRLWVSVGSVLCRCSLYLSLSHSFCYGLQNCVCRNCAQSHFVMVLLLLCPSPFQMPDLFHVFPLTAPGDVRDHCLSIHLPSMPLCLLHSQHQHCVTYDCTFAGFVQVLNFCNSRFTVHWYAPTKVQAHVFIYAPSSPSRTHICTHLSHTLMQERRH